MCMYGVDTFVANSVLFSKYLLKIIAKFLASSKDGLNMNDVSNVGFLS